jgi:subtilisin-like proprotein convertase family protein
MRHHVVARALPYAGATNSQSHLVSRLLLFWSVFLFSLLWFLLNAQPVLADSFVYEDTNATPFDDQDSSTAQCTQPITRTFSVPDSFIINDLNVGFNADHDYRSDIRLTLQSPLGTRVELVTEFYFIPEDDKLHYDFLLDSASTNPLDDGDDDDTSAPYYERTVQPGLSLDAFNGENAQGDWILEICDAGILDSGTYNRSQLAFDGAPVAATPANQVGGTVFRDHNGDGSQGQDEPGAPDLTVRAYDAAGAMIATATTDGRGDYALHVADGQAVRIELDGLPSYLQPGPFGADSATTVAFATSPTSSVHIGINNPAQYCQDPEDTRLATTLFRFGPNDGPFTSEDTLVSFRETDGSNIFVPKNGDKSAYYPTDPLNQASQSQTGALFGLAYDSLHQQLLAGSFVKRHVGLGPTDNPTTIYSADPQLNDSATPWFTLETRSDPHNNPADWIADFAVFDFVGKEGWGDLDMAEDGSTLYGIDLGKRHLVSIPIQTDGSAGAPSTVDLISNLPAGLVGANADQCPADTDLRPFGLGINDGVLYLGMVCSAQSTVQNGDLPITAPASRNNPVIRPGDEEKLRAYVFAWNGDLLNPSFTTILNFPLDYDRGCVTYNHEQDCANHFDAHWAPWVNTFPYTGINTAPYTTDKPFESVYPQPILSDLEFHKGNLILLLADRFGYQVGGFTYSPHNDETIGPVAAAGDILYACQQGAGWVMEELISGDATCGTPGRSYVRGDPIGDRIDEYFLEDTFRARFSLHDDVSFGAGAAIPGRNHVISAVFDPIYRSEAKEAIFDGGLHFYSVGDAHWRRGIELYDGTGDLLADGVFSKAAGLGDVIALCNPGPVEIGNRVWLDANQNGIQDPGETAISGVMVELYQGTTLIDSATTDANGHYYFSSASGTSTAGHRFDLALQYETNYEVRIPNITGANQQTPLAGLTLTEVDDATASPGGSDLNDSDGAANGDHASVNLTIGGPGANNHTYDFGFFAAVTYSLGNQVWWDGNNDAQIDSNETGIVGVALTLYDPNGTPSNKVDDLPIAQATTVAGGLYLFANLQPGDYYVGVDPANFTGSGVLVGYITSNENLDEDDPNLDQDNNDNGMDMAGLIASGIVTLGPGEPTAEDPDNDPNTPDSQENLTVDFGFFRPLTLGNRVWLDDGRGGGALNNGVMDGSEPGITNVVLHLLNANRQPVLNANGQPVTTTTDANGHYLFVELSPVDYIVCAAASNFLAGAPLSGLISSVPTEGDPDADGDRNDNGVNNPAPSQNGLCSAPITLAYTSEPTGETDLGALGSGPAANNNSNLTVDFGFFPPMTLGNRVWLDNGVGGGGNDNGNMDGAERGIAGVLLRLLDSNRQPVLNASGQPMTTTTDANGHYLFIDLTPGQYIVCVDTTNFQAGGPLNLMLSSSPTEADPNADNDRTDNGVNNDTPAQNGICNAPITLAYTSEPTNETDTGALGSGPAANNNSNLTVDFGFVVPTTLGDGEEPRRHVYLPLMYR